MDDSKILVVASTPLHIDDAPMVIHNYKVDQRYHLSNVAAYWLSVLLFGGLNIYFFWAAVCGDFTVFHAIGHSITMAATIIIVRRFREDVRASRCTIRGSRIEYDKVLALGGELSQACHQQGELSVSAGGELEVHKGAR